MCVHYAHSAFYAQSKLGVRRDGPSGIIIMPSAWASYKTALISCISINISLGVTVKGQLESLPT